MISSNKEPTLEESQSTIMRTFIEPFYEYLETGNNTFTPKAFTTANEAVVDECDSNDNSQALHNYAKKLMVNFCEERLLVELKRYRDSELLTRYGIWWSNFKLFTHAINKLFSYLNRYFLKNQ
jgi:hypothetical protein